MMTTEKQKITSLSCVRDFVARVCNTTADYLMLGKYDERVKINSYEDFSHNCFIYEYNKFRHESNQGKLIRKTKFNDKLYGRDGAFNLDEVRLYANFMVNTINKASEMNKEDVYSILRMMLSTLFKIYKTDDNVEQSFDAESYLNELFIEVKSEES